MSKLKEQKAPSPTGVNAKKTDNELSFNQKKDANGKLFNAELLNGTPFVIIEMDGKYHARIGKWAISDQYDDKESLLKAIENPNWNMLIAVMHVVSMEAKEVLNVLSQEEIEQSNKLN